MPPIGLDYDDPREWIIFRFEVFDGRLDFLALVQSTADVAIRKPSAELLVVEAPKVGLKRKQGGKVTGKRTRFSGRDHILEWGGDDEAEAIRVGVKKTLDDLYPKLEKLALVLRPLCALPASAT